MGKEIVEAVEATEEVVEVPEVKDEATEAKPKRKKQKVLSKDLKKNPGCLTMSVVGIEGEIVYDPKELPENVQNELPAFALSHKLGDAASGKSGQEAADAIEKVWNGMMQGDWTVKAPAAKKISVSKIAENLSGLSDEEQEKARKSLAALGIVL